MTYTEACLTSKKCETSGRTLNSLKLPPSNDTFLTNVFPPFKWLLAETIANLRIKSVKICRLNDPCPVKNTGHSRKEEVDSWSYLKMWNDIILVHLVEYSEKSSSRQKVLLEGDLELCRFCVYKFSQTLEKYISIIAYVTKSKSTPDKQKQWMLSLLRCVAYIDKWKIEIFWVIFDPKYYL